MFTASAKTLETIQQQILFGSAQAARSLPYRRPQQPCLRKCPSTVEVKYPTRAAGPAHRGRHLPSTTDRAAQPDQHPALQFRNKPSFANAGGSRDHRTKGKTFLCDAKRGSFGTVRKIAQLKYLPEQQEVPVFSDPFLQSKLFILSLLSEH